MNTTTEKTAGSNLTPIAEYSETALALADLRQRHQGVVYDVTVPKQMKLAKEARAELRTLRTSLEKKRVELKAPILERGRLLDSEAKRLTEELVSLEEPIDVQIKAEEARAEAEKLAKLQAEQERQEAIARAIDDIRAAPANLVGKPSVIIAGQLVKMQDMVLSEDFYAEHFTTARDALELAIARVKQQHADQVAHEAEQKRIEAERAELEKLRAEAEARRIADEQRAAAERAEADRKAQEERDRLAAEQRAKDEDERAERQRQEDEARAQREEQERIEREEQARRRAEQEAALQAERERQAEAQRKLDAQAEQLRKERAAAAKKAEADRLANLGLREAARAIVVGFPTADHIELCSLVSDLAVALQNDAAQAKPARVKKAAA